MNTPDTTPSSAPTLSEARKQELLAEVEKRRPEIEELLRSVTNGAALSNTLFSPLLGGLLCRIGDTPEERKFLSNTDLFDRCLDRVFELKEIEIRAVRKWCDDLNRHTSSEQNDSADPPLDYVI